MFGLFAKTDAKFAEAVDSHMCTDICMCEGEKGDDWYDDYSKLPAEKFA